ncbi:MAG TPA: pentapeptide repeat-containing protein [Candidatus Baltobacteraceae bacterium]|jgi:uncharacterized protein YjbI with pentapeptide repeats/beta-lactamase regulating signal transducer with metallopeptidase domain|nr:pentapeptide repeat-containing protein [Candidatus Baltobacteraceae bacterium]
MLTLPSALQSLAQITVVTLFNSLWEAALLALVVWAILRLTPNVSATTRYAAWSFALVASLLLPIATSIPLVTVQHVTHSANTGVRTRQSSTNSNVRVARESSSSARVTEAAAAASKAPAQSSTPLRLPQRFHFAIPGYVAVALFVFWALAAIALLVRLAVNLYRLERLKTDALPLAVDYRERLAQWSVADKGGREVRLCTCDRIEVPVAVGLFDSMILIPQHLLDSLSQDEIDQIMLHELAHLRRADDWTNGVQRLIQALFFFNPAVLFIAQQLDLEREVACDDWVVRQTARVRPYASCLTKMAEVTAWPHRALAAPGVFVTRRGLSVRVERLLRAGRDVRTSISFGPAGAVVAAFVVMFFVLQSVAPSFAFTLQEDVTIPAQHVQLPSRDIHIAAHDVRTKNGTVHRPAQTIHVGGTTVDIAPQHVRISDNGSQPPGEITIPGQTVHVSSAPIHATTPSRYAYSGRPNVKVEIPSDLSSNAANLGMAAASLGLREAAERMKAISFSRSRLAGNNVNAFNCTGCDYSNQNLAGHNFHGQRFNGSDFSHTDLHGADFSNSQLTGVDFSDADLRGVNFRGANLNGCDMSNADIDGANFDGANVVGCDVKARSLTPEQARQWLRTCRTGCDFSGANLRGQDLSGFELSGVDLSGADLTNTNLSGAKLNGVDLSGARLDGANVNDTEFVGCDLTGVNLNGIDMSRAKFVGDKLEGNPR